MNDIMEGHFSAFASDYKKKLAESMGELERYAIAMYEKNGPNWNSAMSVDLEILRKEQLCFLNGKYSDMNTLDWAQDIFVPAMKKYNMHYSAMGFAWDDRSCSVD